MWRYRADNFFGCQISTRLNWDHIAIGNVNGLHMLYLLYSIFSFICMFCRSLFVLLYFFFCPLCCLFFFNIRILITPLVSTNSSFYSSEVNSRFKPWFCQTNDYDIGIYCSATHVALRKKSKDWLAWNQDNVSEWRDMPTHALLFLCKNPTKSVGLV